MIENELPSRVQELARESFGQLVWQPSVVKAAIDLAAEFNIACIGGTPQFHFPEGICDLYWLSFSVSERGKTESETTYSKRAAAEVLTKVDKLCSEISPEEASPKHWNIPVPENPLNYLVFMLDWERP